jgi:diacylglycerol kinase family enzyme
VGHGQPAGPALLVIPAGTFNHFAAGLGVEGLAMPWPRCATARPSKWTQAASSAST